MPLILSKGSEEPDPAHELHTFTHSLNGRRSVHPLPLHSAHLPTGLGPYSGSPRPFRSSYVEGIKTRCARRARRNGGAGMMFAVYWLVDLHVQALRHMRRGREVLLPAKVRDRPKVRATLPSARPRIERRKPDVVAGSEKQVMQHPDRPTSKGRRGEHGRPWRPVGSAARAALCAFFRFGEVDALPRRAAAA
jgi:hypothetical protein